MGKFHRDFYILMCGFAVGSGVTVLIQWLCGVPLFG